jgi:hypothetical protein
MDGAIRKYNATLSILPQHTCPKQNMNIAVNRADVGASALGSISVVEVEWPVLWFEIRSIKLYMSMMLLMFYDSRDGAEIMQKRPFI